MKRVHSPDSLAASFSIPSSKALEEKTRKNNQGYSTEFQAMLDSLEEDDCINEEGNHQNEKKRRLTLDQVKALENTFEMENKLEPARKLMLAEDLGLQPRQVAIWFQNRRARWKTKQLEKDYGSLKDDYESLKVDYHNLEQEHEALSQKLKQLKARLGEENIADNSQSIKEDFNASELENKVSVHCHSLDFSEKNYSEMVEGQTHPNISPSPHELVNWIQLADSRTILGNGCQVYQPHLLKVEDQSHYSAEESCNFFSVDQPPTLQWYLSE